ncbi:bifunctional Leucine rich repeat 4/Leucine-rich repeat/Leucine-rich repeat domain superfamily [Babesia duncani]|uniref:Bifunctional Leucine rich repeat 4/Leucine-rich repeat/Leucine-rich repeat domain superfamily n=1 Tax=Babesia duncani TaxID=323732 RepID=A0AAD9UQJ2_9APIC|nr:bifunctional Leucine rich repeat 4/Leucine-rich repeat/Leucine-rich repeat domain superfamily [Babesia duncani]
MHEVMALDLSGRALGSLGSSAVSAELQSRNLGLEAVTHLSVSQCGLSSLEGIERFKNLEFLDASYNHITSLVDLWRLPNLKRVRLHHNNISSLCLLESANGIVVITTSNEDVGVVDHMLKFDLLDLGFNNITKVTDFTRGSKLSTRTLILSGNQICDFSGIVAFSNLNVLDIENNIQIDVKHLVACKLSKGCKIFMQDMRVINSEMMNQLVENHLLVHVDPETTDLIHPNLIKMSMLDIGKIRSRVFLEHGSTTNGMAEFVYKGDEFPSELMTRRDHDMGTLNPLVKRVTCPSKYLNTQSTAADIADPHAGDDEISTNSIDNDYASTPQSSVYSEATVDGNDLQGVEDFIYKSVKFSEKLDQWNSSISSDLVRQLERH